MLVRRVNTSKLYNTCIKINMYFVKADIFIYKDYYKKSVDKYFNNILIFKKIM